MAVLRILCLGEGFTSGALSRLLPDIDVRFLSRRRPAPDMEHGGFPFVPQVILDSVPPVWNDGHLINPLYRSAIDRHPDAVFVHLSSTSVYAAGAGEAGAFDVDERSVACPDDRRGQARLDLENIILKTRPGALILRCGGIYGPDRSLPLSLLSGESAHLPTENRFVSRIHVLDLCRLIVAAARRILAARGASLSWPSVFPGDGRENVICAVDPSPSSTAETLAFIREEWELTTPAIPAGPPHGRRVHSLYAGSLLDAFAFPDFRAGFRDSMKGMSPGERSRES